MTTLDFSIRSYGADRGPDRSTRRSPGCGRSGRNGTRAQGR